jgi:hypothetical protein
VAAAGSEYTGLSSFRALAKNDTGPSSMRTRLALVGLPTKLVSTAIDVLPLEERGRRVV